MNKFDKYKFRKMFGIGNQENTQNMYVLLSHYHTINMPADLYYYYIGQDTVLVYLG